MIQRGNLLWTAQAKRDEMALLTPTPDSRSTVPKSHTRKLQLDEEKLRKIGKQ